jgi:hypothetical protein
MGSAKERTLTKFYTKQQDLYGHTYLITTKKFKKVKSLILEHYYFYCQMSMTIYIYIYIWHQAKVLCSILCRRETKFKAENKIEYYLFICFHFFIVLVE